MKTSYDQNLFSHIFTNYKKNAHILTNKSFSKDSILVAIVLMAIISYFINGYWWILVVILG
jgi:hypothetical protein